MNTRTSNPIVGFLLIILFMGGLTGLPSEVFAEPAVENKPVETVMKPALVWKQIQPGKSTRAEVLEKLGTPYMKRAKGKFETLFWKAKSSSTVKAVMSDTVRLDDGVVDFIRVGDTVYFDSDPDKVRELYGKPEGFVTMRYSEISYYMLYPTQGLGFLVDEGPGLKKATVVALILFEPATLEGLKERFGW